MTARAASFAAVLVAHGDRGGHAPNIALPAQAAAVHALIGAPVATGLLKGEPTIEQAMAEAAATGAPRIVVYPLFMADGYFVRKVHERIAAIAHTPEPVVLAPLGSEPGLPDIMMAEALAAAERGGIDPAAARLLVVGHGSKLGPASAAATRKAAARVALARRFASVTTAFLEEEPFLEDALRASPTPTVVAGFFFGDGLHAAEDVPAAIAETGGRAVYTGAVGNVPAAAHLIAASLMRAPRPDATA